MYSRLTQSCWICCVMTWLRADMVEAVVTLVQLAQELGPCIGRPPVGLEGKVMIKLC